MSPCLCAESLMDWENDSWRDKSAMLLQTLCLQGCGQVFTVISEQSKLQKVAALAESAF